MTEKSGVRPNAVHPIPTARWIQPYRLEHDKLSRDKRFEEKLRDGVGRSLNPPEHARVLSAAEMTPRLALDRTAPSAVDLHRTSTISPPTRRRK